MGTAGISISTGDDLDGGNGSAGEGSKEEPVEAGITGLPSADSTCGSHRTFFNVGIIAISMCGSLLRVVKMAGGSKAGSAMGRPAGRKGVSLLES